MATATQVNDHGWSKLRDILTQANAPCLAIHPMRDHEGKRFGRIQVFAVSGRVAYVTVYELEDGTPSGWDVFVPVTDSGEVDATLAAFLKWAAGARVSLEAKKAQHEEVSKRWTPGSLQYSEEMEQTAKITLAGTPRLMSDATMEDETRRRA